MASTKTTLTFGVSRPYPTGSYRSPQKPGMVHLKAPSDFLAQLALAGGNSSNQPATASSTNPPTPNRTSTPTGSKETPGPASAPRLETGSSRAASAAPADRTADRVAMPTEPAAHGAPTRQYLNSKVTYHVLEGMKIVAKERPADPLRVLGEFLLRRSAELSSSAGADGAVADDKDKPKENGADVSVME